MPKKDAPVKNDLKYRIKLIGIDSKKEWNLFSMPITEKEFDKFLHYKYEVQKDKKKEIKCK